MKYNTETQHKYRNKQKEKLGYKKLKIGELKFIYNKKIIKHKISWMLDIGY